MPVITISADWPEKGAEIAKMTAQKLGCQCLGPEILAEVARQHQVSAADLQKALDRRPGLLSMRARRRRRLLNLIESAVLEMLRTDNLVCHGLGAQLYARGVSHVLRVRVIADKEQRAQDIAQRLGLPLEKARKLASQRDDDQRHWSLDWFGLDATDPGIYDLVISLGTIDDGQAVDIIAETAGSRRFQPNTYSQKCLRDRALASRVRRELFEHFPESQVDSSDGTVVIRLKIMGGGQRKKQEQARLVASQIPGVEYVEVQVIKDFFAQAAAGGR